MKTPINTGILQSDLDCAGFDLINFSGGSGGTAHGIPAGGTAGQSLTKIDGTDYNAHWSTVSGGGSTPNTVTSTDIGLVGDGVTDNTTAFQTWLNSVETADVNATLIVEDGVYVFSGPLQDTSARNAQILLPRPAHYITLTIKGRQAIPTWVSAASVPPTLPLPAGARFKSTLSTGGGASPSFIGGHGTLADQNQLHLCIENMMFQTVGNPQISCLNLELITWVDFTRDVLIVAGDRLDNPSAIQPTNTSSCGLIMPMTNIGVLHTVENIHVFQFYTGIAFGEIAHFKNIGAYACKYALQFGFAYHANLIERVLIFHCTNGIRILGGACPLSIIQLDIEHENPAGPWYVTIYDIDDPNNYGSGDITWWVVKGGVGVDTTFTVNGGANIKYRRLGSDTHAGPLYIGTDLRLVAMSGGGKLQARNTGTNTWADVDQWTNP